MTFTVADIENITDYMREHAIPPDADGNYVWRLVADKWVLVDPRKSGGCSHDEIRLRCLSS